MRNLAKLLLLACFVPAFAFSQTPVQQQQLTALTTSFITMYNAADTAQSRTFINNTNAKAARFLEQLQREQGFIGHVDVKNIRVVSPTETHALVQTPRFETWWQVIVLTDSQQRFKEHHMRLLRVTNDVLQNRHYTNIELGQAIDSFIQRQSVYQPFSGNVLIEKDGLPLYTRSFGKNKEGKPHEMQDLFGLASVGKMFTAISILQLADQKKLSLSDSVGGLLPELKNKKLSAITIQQLLTHTSGMGDFFEDPAYSRVMDSMRALPATAGVPSTLYLPYFESDNLRFAPGAGWAYSNTGFELLQYILEKTTGLSYSAYVTAHILKPAGMTKTELGSGAGGGRATVADLAHFAAALRSGKFLSKELTQQFFDYQVNEQYGWGSEHQRLGNETIVGHSGGFENVCNELNLYTRSGYTVIILSDMNPPFAHFLGDKIKTLLVQKAL